MQGGQATLATITPEQSSYRQSKKCRSATTALADAGISITNLKQAGRWKSDAVAEGYLENSTAQKNERMSML
eukprot:12842900-Ditylum_brightwellii.AAC.1